jgi:6-phosphogluconolactonase|tara:strand:+ start:875 stop:1513 length:639 start_codon:yes stop_codon:yes gene_type:complete
LFIDLQRKFSGGTFVVPGGKTPHFFYHYLAHKVKVWSDTTLLLSDERLVEESLPESNMGMIKNQLVDQITANTKPNLLPAINGYSPEQTNQLVEKLNFRVKSFLPLQAAFLGIGSDGHTASLFPGFEERFFSNDPFIVIDRKSESFKRVSLSATILTQTPLLIFLVSGIEKQPIVDRILNESNDGLMLPVLSIIQKAKADVLLLSDQQAAAQ